MAVIQMEREATLCVRILIQLHLLVAVVHLMVGGLHHTSTGYLVSVKGVDVVTMKGASATQGYRNVGSQLIVKYVASYQWSITAKNWQIVKDSSFNTDGSRQEFDCAKPNGGLDKSLAWMQPQPGGAAAWTWGYYPAGVKGVGHLQELMLFMLSLERVWNMAWCMLNQVTLDKGPNIFYPNDECAYGNNNCWAAGNAGEIDFLESVWTKKCWHN